MIDRKQATDTAKKAIHAAIGAPVVTTRRVGDKLRGFTERIKERGENLTDEARKEYDTWAEEGSKLIDRFGDQPVVEQITTKIEDLDVEGQVGKLRDQLDDMLESWKKGFRPEDEKPADKAEAPKPAAKKPAAKKPAAKKPAAKKPAAKTTAAKKPAAKTTAAKKPAAKKPAAKKPAAKAGASA